MTGQDRTEDHGSKKDNVVIYDSDISVIAPLANNPPAKTAITTSPVHADSQHEASSQSHTISSIE